MTKRPRGQAGEKLRGLSHVAFPALRAFLRGYLHQDFEEVHGSLRAAAAAFRSDASLEEREQLTKELESLVTLVADLPARRLRLFIEELGSGWVPDSKDEIGELLEVMRAR